MRKGNERSNTTDTSTTVVIVILISLWKSECQILRPVSPGLHSNSFFFISSADILIARTDGFSGADVRYVHYIEVLGDPSFSLCCILIGF